MKVKLSNQLLYPLPMLVTFLLPACSSQLAQRVTSIGHAFAYGNIDSTLAVVYTDDVRFELGAIILEGKQAMRVAAGWDSVVNSHFFYSDYRSLGDTVVCKCTEENDLDKMLGIEHGYFDPVSFVFDHSRIMYVKFQRTAESRHQYNAAWDPFTKWASVERGQELAALMPAGKFAVSAQTAEGWLALAREWRKVTKSR
jgi:hypothetical protein